MLSGLRAGRGESQGDLAAAAVASPDAVSRWERGKLSALADHFDIPVSKLYCGYSESPTVETVAYIKKSIRFSVVSIVAAAAILLLISCLLTFIFWPSREPSLYTVTLDGNEISVSENDWFIP